jgi:hypothetical protein
LARCQNSTCTTSLLVVLGGVVVMVPSKVLPGCSRQRRRHRCRRTGVRLTLDVCFKLQGVVCVAPTHLLLLLQPTPTAAAITATATAGAAAAAMTLVVWSPGCSLMGGVW